MTTEKPSTPTKLCPTCGTRVNEDASRCLVCGSDLSGNSEKANRTSKTVQGSRMPEVTLSLPAVLGLLALFLAIGATMVFFALRETNQVAVAEVTATATVTLTPTETSSPTPATPTITNTPEPSPTPQSYTVNANDTCSGIAFAFNVSIQSIVLLNNLPADCSTLFEGQQLLIPQPTPTATPPPTATLSPAEATEQACGSFEYTVQENDTLSSIALNFAVTVLDIREYNGLVDDTVRFGQVLQIPLCRQRTGNEPTPTATPYPPYPAPNLLLPADGAAFTLADGEVTLQWASVGTLRESESYAVTIEDVTEGQSRKLVAYVNDTKYIVPSSFRASDNMPHVMRWWIQTVRQVGTDDDGNPIWEPAGALSIGRVFTWTGVSPAGTPTP